MQYTLAVDAMSGDLGPRVTLGAARDFIAAHEDVSILLAGDPEVLEPLLNDADGQRLRLVPSGSVVTMADRPSWTLRHRRDSSMYIAIEQVASGAAQAAVSAGNTGALMAMGRYLLHTHPGIDRPAIATPIPTAGSPCYLLDLGANVDCGAEHLFQFALLGASLFEALEGEPRPRIGLLNVGAEETKGNEQVKLAARLIQEHPNLNYIGYVEGNDLYSGRADVIVCDGFVGNVALKSSEGLARLLGSALEEAFRSSLYRRLLGVLARPVLGELKQFMDPSRHNGASLLGLQGTLVKSHGSANRQCFGHALAQARVEVHHGVPGMTNRNLARLV